jgi:subtilase family serine protease
MNRWFENLQYIHDNYERSYDAQTLYKNTQCIETSDGSRYSMYDIYTAKVLENTEAQVSDAIELDVEEL